MEPSFIAQGVVPEGEETEWYRRAIEEGKKRGAAFCRMSWDTKDPSKLLFEAWIERPEDQGPLRWDHPEAVKLA